VGAIGWPIGTRFLTEEDSYRPVGDLGPGPSSITTSARFGGSG
jgi:hypothetical protein